MAHNQLDFAQLFRDYHPQIYRYVRYRVSDEMVAEDLTAEIFERAYRFLKRYDPGQSAFGTWLARIARNWVNNHVERQKRRDHHEADLGDDVEKISSSELTPEAQIISSETLLKLLACVGQLPPRDREVIALRFGLDMRNKDIAAITGIKEHSVSVILLRALERLRGCQEGA